MIYRFTLISDEVDDFIREIKKVASESIFISLIKSSTSSEIIVNL